MPAAGCSHAKPTPLPTQVVTPVEVSTSWLVLVGSQTVGGNIGSPYQTLVEHWDGSSWSIVSSPNATGSVYGTADNRLWAVACAAGSECCAVGSGGELQLTEHYGSFVQSNAVQLNEVASRKTHASAGTFDVDLPLTGSPGVECRRGGANGDYTLIFTFANLLTSVGGASVTSGIGSVTASNFDYGDPHNYIVNLTGVTNAQVLKVGLTNVSDSAGDFSPAVAGQMGVLIGDTSGDRAVNSADITQTRRQSGNVAGSSNFRADVTGDGVVNSADITLVRRQSGTALP